MFLEMQNFPAFESQNFNGKNKQKNVSKISLKTLIFLLFSCELHSQNHFLGQNMIEMYTPSVFRDNLSFKIILAPLLSRERCKKYTETLSFPSKICRLKVTDNHGFDKQFGSQLRWFSRTTQPANFLSHDIHALLTSFTGLLIHFAYFLVQSMNMYLHCEQI